MPAIIENHLKNPNHNSDAFVGEILRKRRLSLPDIWYSDQQLRHAILRMQKSQQSDLPETPIKTAFLAHDPFSLLSDESVSLILSKLQLSERFSISLVCKRWFSLHGRLLRTLSILDWDLLLSRRFTGRFPNLVEVNLVPACFWSSGGSGVMLSHKVVSTRLGFEFLSGALIGEGGVLSSDLVDEGLRVLASECPSLRKLVLANPSEKGLGFIAEKCLTLQEMEIHCCKDMSLCSIACFQNLQMLKLIGSIEGLYDSRVTDIGLTIVAQGCRRLVKLELSGCEGSYDGIKAIGQCCEMLEELTLQAHKMEGGWLLALPYCSNLKTLRLQSCKNIDMIPGPYEHLGSCLVLEELNLEKCQMRDKSSVKALFMMCESVGEISFKDCWGLDDEAFNYVTICRKLKSLSLEGCSLLTSEGLDSVVHTSKELQTLRVVSCKNIKDTEITSQLATLFSVLKGLKWRPKSRYLVTPSLAASSVGKKGGKFFKRMITIVDKRK